MDNIFNSAKEFIWDIIGYLIPGAITIILIKMIFNIELNGDKNNFLFIIISYIIGHIIYGLNIYIYETVLKNSYIKETENEVKTREEFIISRKKIITLIDKNEINEQTSVRTIRSLVMSYIPESDSKIYTFTFRSELSNSCSTIFIIFGIIGLLLSILKYSFNQDCIDFENFKIKWILFYLILIISSIFLRKTRNRFYRMSLSIPFYIFSTKNIKNEN